MALRGKAVRHLRALAHNLEPVVHIGKDGVTKAVIASVDRALLDHELIKVRLLQQAPVDRRDAADLISIGTSSELVQILGRVIVLYRAHPEEPKIVLPKTSSAT